MLTDKLTSELSRTPADLAANVARYVKESCTLDPASALTATIQSALPSEEDEDAYPPRLVSVPDYMTESDEPLLALMPGFLSAKKLICLSGAAKESKSLVGLELLHSVSTGRKFMGRFSVENPGPVAYFGFEDSRDEIQSRLIQRGCADLKNFYVCSQSFDMATAAGLGTFKRLISEMPEPPLLIVIDTVQEAFKLKDWDNDSLVHAAISPIRKWAHKNCTVILITHDNNIDKFATGVDKLSASGAFVSSCDSFMTLFNGRK